MNQLTDMHNYETEEGFTLADIYSLMFRSLYPLAFSKRGESDACKNFKQHATQLQRFRVDCDLGNVAVTLRQPDEGEHWTVPVAEGFIEYLSQRTTLRCEEYGIDVADIILPVIAQAVDHEPFLIRFVPEKILSREWLLMMVGPVPGIVKYIDVADELMRELIEAYPMAIIHLYNGKCTKELALVALRKEPMVLIYLPEEFQLDACKQVCEELRRENYRLKKQLAA
ncbi:DUF4116 domain-containing protein [Pseudomonas sp. D(2018)]|uniref:DUF4116 domain-containing protein n=1 Tax=Pseudomonas sp. D(2018) TaxID=2502238 RepID=UPI0010F6BDF1|nr:DUF4116 domain-containing protein [Pseudomonas sp. D(2018)]